ncbi:hypothetical protein Tco_0800808 [Tanacetum coccineum]|uniref:Uncharacterized protein n=1 Tax=Tanacetum coccineum TaxID=301880 RepID=A0ABQ4ZU72_9ASTR
MNTAGAFCQSIRHSTLGADQIDHQFLGVDNGSSPLVYSIPVVRCTSGIMPVFLLDKQDGAPRARTRSYKALSDSSFVDQITPFISEGANSLRCRAIGAALRIQNQFENSTCRVGDRTRQVFRNTQESLELWYVFKRFLL